MANEIQVLHYNRSLTSFVYMNIEPSSHETRHVPITPIWTTYARCYLLLYDEMTHIIAHIMTRCEL